MLEKRILLHSALCGAVLGAAALMASGSANAITITNNSPAWVIVPGSVGPTGGIWGLPADLSGIGCGTENETTCEPTGNFTLSTGITTAAGYYTIADPDGSVGDVITFGNTGPGGTGQIQFYSDPDLPVLGGLTGTNYGSLCTEGPVQGGCVGTFGLTLVDGSSLTVEPASDGESFFDPFGFNFDTSDQIRFTCTSTAPGGAACQLVQAPEPGSLVMFLTALVAGGFGLMWRVRASGTGAA